LTASGAEPGSRLRLLHLAEGDDTSGYFPQLARFHDRSRYQMSFATLKPMAPWLRDFMQDQGVDCWSLGCRTRAAYGSGLARLALGLRRRRIDVLHTHLFDPSVVGLAAGTLARTPLRVLTRHHSDYHTRIGKRWHVRLDQLTTRLSHVVIAVSRHTAEHLIEREGAPRDKVRVVLNGIDFERVRVSRPDAPARLRAELAEGADHLLLIAARLHPEKGYETLLAALPLLRPRLARPVRLLIAGTGQLEASYRALAATLGCADSVRFLGFRRDLPDLIAAADLFVLPSLAEAFGLVLAEALYLGTPVVATRVGGIPEIVVHGVDGVLVPPNDSESLAQALAELLTDAPRRARLAGAGHDKVAARLGFETMVRRYEAIYAERLGHGAA